MAEGGQQLENQHLVRAITSLRGGLWYCGSGQQKGYYFRIDKRKGNTIHVKCVKCRVRAAIDLDAHGNRLQLRITGENVVEHDHAPNYDEEKCVTKHRKLLDRATVERGDLKKIHSQETNTKKVPLRIASKLCFRRVRGGMVKRRQRAQPRIPETLLQMVAAIRRKAPDLGRTLERRPFLFSYQENGVLFLCPINELLLVKSEDVIFTVDGTFKAAPKKPKIHQIYTLGAIYRGIFVPICFALLREKTAEIYKWMFRELQQHSPDWNPTIFITDYETGSISAIKEVFPNARISGCWFHFTQAIQRKCGNLGLIPLIKQDEYVKGSIKKLMALALLPAQWIPLGLLHVKVDFVGFENYPHIQSLLQYMEDFWLQRIGPEIISVAGNDDRTNNYHESFHSTILLYCGDSRRVAHPNIWRFLEALQQIEHETAAKLIAAMLGDNLRYPRSQKWIDQDAQIRDANNKLHQLPPIGDPTYHDVLSIRIEEFLNRAQHFLNFEQQENEDDPADEM